MSSVLSATLAPAIAPAANVVNQGSGTGARTADFGTSSSANAQLVLSSQAAVVTLSVEGQARAASSGSEGRRVDAGYDKQGAKGLSDSDSGEKKTGKQKTVSVQA